MKRTKPLQRRPGYRLPRGKGPSRQQGVRKVNRPRKASEFARCYGSRERVAFVKSLPCACGCGRGPSDNAHVGGNGGMGRKGDYTTIAPLFRECHRAFDERRFPFDDPDVRAFIEDAADRTERLWQSHLTTNGRAVA